MSTAPRQRHGERTPPTRLRSGRRSQAGRARRERAPCRPLTFGWRGMLKVKHVPEQLLDVTITPVMFVLMFTYLFERDRGLDQRVPGLHPSRHAGDVGAVHHGVLRRRPEHGPDQGRGGRFRSLPIFRPAPLLGALLGDSVRYVIGGTVIVVLGVILGYRPPAYVGGVLAALALVVVFSFGLSWIFTTLGLLMRAPNAVMNAGFMGIFPLTFLSNVFVDPDTLPSALEAFVNVNPISILADASRGFMEGNVDAEEMSASPSASQRR